MKETIELIVGTVYFLHYQVYKNRIKN